MDGSSRPETLRTKLGRLAKRLIAKHKGDREDAVEAMILQISRDKALVSEAIDVAARYLIRQCEWISRADIRREIEVPAANPDNAAGLIALANTTRTIMERYVLPSGIAIGDACRADIESAITVHRDNEAGNRRSRKFLEKLLPMLRGKKRVRDCVSVSKLTELYTGVSQ